MFHRFVVFTCGNYSVTRGIVEGAQAGPIAMDIIIYIYTSVDPPQDCGGVSATCRMLSRTCMYGQECGSTQHEVLVSKTGLEGHQNVVLVSKKGLKVARMRFWSGRLAGKVSSMCFWSVGKAWKLPGPGSLELAPARSGSLELAGTRWQARVGNMSFDSYTAI